MIRRPLPSDEIVAGYSWALPAIIAVLARMRAVITDDYDEVPHVAFGNSTIHMPSSFYSPSFPLDWQILYFSEGLCPVRRSPPRGVCLAHPARFFWQLIHFTNPMSHR